MADHTAPAAPRAAARHAPWAPARLTGALPGQAALLLVGTVVLAASSWIEVPMIPVPMTMQTFAVVMVGALYGRRLGTLTTLAWLAQGALGLPVFAGGAGGIGHLAGPTGGYLAAFPLMALGAGWAAEAGWLGRSSVRATTVMLAAHALAFALGVSWLATHTGWAAAVTAGLLPFLPGMALKSLLAGLLARAAYAPRAAP